jgi:hypothetical protein
VIGLILAVFGFAGTALLYNLYSVGSVATPEGPCAEDSFLGEEPSEADFINTGRG